jgi:hypothetical protein
VSDDDRYDKFERFRAEAAEKLRLPVDNDRVRLLAALKLNHEALLERMIRGDNVSPDHVTTLTEAIEGMLPPEVPSKINIQIVQGVVGIYTCKHCGARNELEEGSYQAPKEKDSSRTIDAEPVKADEPEAKALPASAVRPERPAPREVMLPRLPIDESWKSHVAGTGSNPYGVGDEPHPYRANGHDRSGHSLPDGGSLVWWGK